MGFTYAKHHPIIQLNDFYNPTVNPSTSGNLLILKVTSNVLPSAVENSCASMEAIALCVYLAQKGLPMPALRSTVPSVDFVFWQVDGWSPNNGESTCKKMLKDAISALESGQSCFVLWSRGSKPKDVQCDSLLRKLIQQISKCSNSMLVLSDEPGNLAKFGRFEESNIEYIYGGLPKTADILHAACKPRSAYHNPSKVSTSG